MPNPPLKSDYFDEYPPKPNNLSAQQVNLMAQRTDQALDLGSAAATRLDTLEGAGLVTLLGTQTLVNKTLTDPRMNRIRESTAGNEVLRLAADAVAVNYFQITASQTGTRMRLFALGGDDNINVDIIPKGAGTLRQNNVPVATLTDAQTLTNKTLTSPVLNNSRVNLGLYDAAGAVLVALTPSATPVNYFRMRSADSGNPLILQAAGNGGDTDIGINVIPLGAGRATVVNLSATSPILTNPRINSLFDSNGAQAISVNPTASSVNCLFLVPGSAGASVSLRAIGADADIPIGYFSKGLGQVQLRSDTNGFLAVFQPVANAVNYLAIQNAPAGGPVQVSAVGSDANVSILHWPKGAGNFQIYASAGQTPIVQSVGADANIHFGVMTKGTGGFRVFDDAGNVVMMTSRVASGVNYLNVANAPTNSNVLLIASGSDANVGLRVRVKGTGPFAVDDYSANPIVRFMPATASANFLQFYSANAGANPLMQAQGTDTDVNLVIAAKNAGAIILQSVIRHRTYTTAGRPAAATAGEGAEYYDTTTKKPIYSDGTTWRDAVGVAA